MFDKPLIVRNGQILRVVDSITYAVDGNICKFENILTEVIDEDHELEKQWAIN